MGEDALRSAQCIQLDARYYYGMGTFLFLPYRSMTDEEMAAQLFKMGLTARTQEETEKARNCKKGPPVLDGVSSAAKCRG